MQNIRPLLGLGRDDELEWDSRGRCSITPSGAYGKKLGQLDRLAREAVVCSIILTSVFSVRVCARPVSPVTMLPVPSSVSQPPPHIRCAGYPSSWLDGFFPLFIAIATHCVLALGC